MLRRAIIVWVLGLLTLVPYGAYYLFVHASRDQYPLLIVLILFWIFGFWGVVGPLLAAIKVRKVFRAIEQAKTKESLIAALRSDETREMVVDQIAAENHIPHFLARRVYALLIDRLVDRADAERKSSL